MTPGQGKLQYPGCNRPELMTPDEFAEFMGGAVKVKLVRDTWYTVCLDCGVMFMDGYNAFWTWRQSEAMHQDCMGHRFQRYGRKPESQRE